MGVTCVVMLAVILTSVLIVAPADLAADSKQTAPPVVTGSVAAKLSPDEISDLQNRQPRPVKRRRPGFNEKILLLQRSAPTANQAATANPTDRRQSCTGRTAVLRDPSLYRDVLSEPIARRSLTTPRRALPGHEQRRNASAGRFIFPSPARSERVRPSDHTGGRVLAIALVSHGRPALPPPFRGAVQLLSACERANVMILP